MPVSQAPVAISPASFVIIIMDIEWTDYLFEHDENDFTVLEGDWFHLTPLSSPYKMHEYDDSNFDLLDGLDAVLAKSSRPRNEWTPEEDELLVKTHTENRTKGWDFIAKMFPFHTEKQVKRRYFLLVKNMKPRGSVDDLVCVRPKNFKVLSIDEKLKFIENVKEHVKTLENAIHDSTSRIQAIMKKYDKMKS